MKPVFTFFLLFTCLQLQAQFAIVKDKDGYCHVRQKAGTASAITGRVPHGDLVFYMETAGEWYNIDYYKNNEVANGYVHKSRLILIDSLPVVKGSRKGNDSIVFRKGPLEICIRIAPFAAKNNRLEYGKGDNKRTVVKINHRSFWGTDGDIPTHQYKSITCTWKGKEVAIPDSAWYDLFNPGLHMVDVKYDADNERWFIDACNSDGAGTYYVLWMFEKGDYKKRAIYNGF